MRYAGDRVDAALIDAARHGDERAFRELVGRHQNVVSAFAYSLTGDLGRSEELAQDVFVVAWEHLGELREPDRFRSWLFGITRNLRSRHGPGRLAARAVDWKDLVDGEVASAEPSALDRIISREEQAALWRALGRIPESYRVPLVLFYREGQSAERVAEVLNMTANNVRHRLVRGRRMLHEEVLRLLESALSRRRPRKRFVATVMAAVAAWRAGDAAAGGRATGSGRVGRGLLTAAAIPAGLCVLACFLLVDRGRAFLRGRQGVPMPGAAYASPATPFTARTRAMVPLLRAPEPLPAPAEPAGFEFDFEDGVLPSLFTRGHLTPAPAGSSSRFCLIGTVAIDWPITYLVRIGQSPSTLFHYSSGGVLSFDYWVGDDVDIDGRTGRRLAALVSRVVADESRYAGVMPITVSVKDLRQAQNHHAYIAEYVREAWGHAELPLTALRDGQYRQALEPGDPIGQIVIGAGIPGGKPFYVDNVRLVIAPSPVALR